LAHQPGEVVAADLHAGPAQGVMHLAHAVDAVVRLMHRADLLAQADVGD
jgi:hypothetical protein